jgi:hypothetical protein
MTTRLQFPPLHKGGKVRHDRATVDDDEVAIPPLTRGEKSNTIGPRWMTTRLQRPLFILPTAWDHLLPDIILEQGHGLTGLCAADYESPSLVFPGTPNEPPNFKSSSSRHFSNEVDLLSTERQFTSST